MMYVAIAGIMNMKNIGEGSMINPQFSNPFGHSLLIISSLAFCSIGKYVFESIRSVTPKTIAPAKIDMKTFLVVLFVMSN